ncbi:hypothetical protein DGWBC_1723 [Dehalogenimonas sp. WBC-2]|nr:hypothetical protein DGWBC_1723 [Dehalogenimonas sp. WBC-2]
MNDLDKTRVLAVAHDAAAKRGYVTYSDFNDYLRELIIKKRLQPIEGGRVQWPIKKMLEDQANSIENRYVHSRAGAKTLFYPAAFIKANPLMEQSTRQGRLE